MRRFLALAVVLFSVDLPAQPPAPIPVPAPPPLFIKHAAEEFTPIYKEILRLGFGNNVGHTIAASMIASCLPPDRPEVKVGQLEAGVRELSRSPLAVIKGSFIRGIECDPRITMLAATLVCKRGTRSMKEMVDKLHLAYEAMIKAGYTDAFRNVQASAHLME